MSLAAGNYVPLVKAWRFSSMRLEPSFPNRSELSTNRTVGFSRITLSLFKLVSLDLN
jgi:hypothetical protein